MHNCKQSPAVMTDLLFQSETSSGLEEIKQCLTCYAEYLALRETLAVYDEGAAMTNPVPHYWTGYEAQLRAKIAAQSSPTNNNFMLGVLLRPSWIVPILLVMTGLSLATVWNWRDRSPQNYPQESARVAIPEKEPERKSAPQTETNLRNDAALQAYSTQDNPPANRPKKNSGRPEKPGRKQGVRPLDKKPFAIFDPNPLSLELAPPPEVSALDTARNLERAQMLLRGFRNVQPSEDGITFDVTDEKTRSRTLVTEITKLRRSAEATGNLPLEDALSGLEPILLDIANLPARATVDDVIPIKERMQRNEIVGMLQNYMQSWAATVAVAD